MRQDIAQYIQQYPRKERSLLNKSEIARRFGCDPRTVDRHIKIADGQIVTKKSKRQYKSKLEGFESTIKEKVDKYGCTAMATYKFIHKKGFEGKYTIVADFVRRYKKNEIKKATIRFETSPGLQAQVDWKENITMVSRHGEIYKVNIFLMVLGYSRMKFTCLTTNRNQETLFSSLIEGFRYFTGIPKEILFDNMKTVVDRTRTTFTRVEFNDTFKHFADDAGFKPIACMPYRPQTKGKVESLARLVNRLKVYN
ncbi:MAG: IS21 family transposase, partial [Chlorobiales bacterium]|nr:IS21 family transposase [Chlorobiales bacterium]